MIAYLSLLVFQASNVEARKLKMLYTSLEMAKLGEKSKGYKHLLTLRLTFDSNLKTVLAQLQDFPGSLSMVG